MAALHQLSLFRSDGSSFSLSFPLPLPLFAQFGRGKLSWAKCRLHLFLFVWNGAAVNLGAVCKYNLPRQRAEPDVCLSLGAAEPVHSNDIFWRHQFSGAVFTLRLGGLFLGIGVADFG